MYIYITLYSYIYIYTYLQHPPVLKFGLLAKSIKIQPLKIKKKPLAVFLSKKSVLGRSSLSHVQVALFQVVIPMLELLDTVGACY